jgi:hypothetical protein
MHFMLLSSSSLASQSVGGVVHKAGVRVGEDGGLAGVTHKDEVLHFPWLARVARSSSWMFCEPR